MTPLLKGGLGLLTIGTVAGVGYAGSTYFGDSEKKDTVNQPTGIALNKLIEERHDYKLLDTSSSNKDEEKWTQNWQSYKKESKNVFNLTGWDAGNSDLNLISALKEECKKLSETTVYDNGQKHYENVTKYCGRGVTFEEQAEKENLEILDSAQNKHSDIWTQKLNEKTDLDADLKKIGIANTPTTADQIKKGCGTAKTNNKQMADYEATYKAYTKICTQPKK